MKTQGAGGVEFDVLDYSVLIQTGLKGLTAMYGPTERGEEGKTYVIGSWENFQEELGGLMADNDFPMYCKRALEAGARLRIGRAFKYTNPSDRNSVIGLKAVGTWTQATTAETKAIFRGTLSSVTTGNNVSLSVQRPGQATVDIGTVAGSATVAATLTALAAAVNGGTGTHGFTATATTTTIDIIAPTGTGAWANGYKVFGYTIAPDLFADNPFLLQTPGVTAMGNATVPILAKSIGTWANAKLSVVITRAASNLLNAYDIKVTLIGYENIEETYTDITAWDADTINDINSRSRFIQIGTTTGTPIIGAVILPFSGGTYNYNALTVDDYVGDATGSTGIHIFDDWADMTKIAIPHLAEPELDLALANYVTMRKDLIALLRTPVGLTPDATIDYREGTGSYSHVPVNTWMGFMFTGGLSVKDPITKQPRDISELADVVGLIATKDNKAYEWFSFSGPTRGVIRNALGVVVNYATPARQVQFDNVDIHGINAVVNDKDFGIVSWGNSTLQKANTLLKKAEVAELLVFLTRTITPLVRSEIFNPNDMDTWKAMYRKVSPFLEFVKTKRGLWKYLYQGDQDAMSIDQCVINSSANVDAGAYIFRLFIAPKVAMKYVGYQIVVTNSNVSFEEYAGQPLAV